jgi:hypothetical protein
VGPTGVGVTAWASTFRALFVFGTLKERDRGAGPQDCVTARNGPRSTPRHSQNFTTAQNTHSKKV